MKHILTLPIVLFLALLGTAGLAAPLELSLTKVQTTDSQISRIDSGAVRVETGHKHQWPGVTIVAPDGHWDLSRCGHVEVVVKNTGTQVLKVACRVDGEKGNGKDRADEARFFRNSA
ncbi:MAG: hypothetical protein ABMA01_12785 [Chthoniobacteraceae bacterium]